MAGAVVVRGRISDSTHVELEQPLSGLRGQVEVTLRPVLAPRVAPTTPLAEWMAAFDSWIASHDSSLPVLSTEALRRESLYEER